MTTSNPRPNLGPFVAGVVAGALVLGLFIGLALSRINAGKTIVPPAATQNVATTPTPQRYVPGQPIPAFVPRPGGGAEENITRRDDGLVVVRAGRGSMNVFPQSAEPYVFGMHVKPGPASDATRLSRALVNADAPRVHNLSPEQESELQEIGPLPQPAAATREAIIGLFEAFVFAADADRPAAQAALLDAVRQEAEDRSSAIDDWDQRRAEVLTEAQRTKILRPAR